MLPHLGPHNPENDKLIQVVEEVPSSLFQKTIGYDFGLYLIALMISVVCTTQAKVDIYDPGFDYVVIVSCLTSSLHFRGFGNKMEMITVTITRQSPELAEGPLS